jgi:hypothetical protein
MNKENTVLFTGGHGKRVDESEPLDKKVLLDKGQITGKPCRLEEPSSPIGAALLKRKREFQSRPSKPLESIALFSCENCQDV